LFFAVIQGEEQGRWRQECGKWQDERQLLPLIRTPMSFFCRTLGRVYLSSESLLEAIFSPTRRKKRHLVIPNKRLTTQLGGKWLQPCGLRLKMTHFLLLIVHLE